MRPKLVPSRSYEPEILDGPNSYEDIAGAMRDIALSNRWLGGEAAIVRPVLRIVEGARLREVSLLDVGTGAADGPIALTKALERRGIAVRSVGVDLDPHVVRYAARSVLRSPVSLLRADGFALPFEDRAFDIVTSSMFFHHFDERGAARLLGEFARVARRAVVINDLRRHRASWLIVHVFARLIGAGRLFRNDAPLSVLRGWTADELLEVAALAGLDGAARVVRPVPYRLALVVDRDGEPHPARRQATESAVDVTSRGRDALRTE